MDFEEKQRLGDLAVQIAQTEILRRLVGHYLYDADPDTFRRRLSAFEAAVVEDLTSRTHFAQASKATNEYVREAASGYASRVLGTINHAPPDDHVPTDGDAT